MNHPARHPPSPPTPDPGVPDDMAWPPGMTVPDLHSQLRAARSEVHRWREANAHRTTRERGHHAMAPITYRAGLQVRLAIYHSLLRLQQITQPQPELPTS